MQNNKSKTDRDTRITDLSRLLISVPAMILGIALFVVGVVVGLLNPDNKIPQALIAVVLANIGSLIAVHIAVSLYSQPIQRSFASEVLNRISLSENVMEAGIKAVFLNQRDIPWEDLFRKSKEISLFFVTNNTWRKTNALVLEDFIKRKGNTLTVILPDPANNVIVDEISNRLRRDSARCRKEIEDVCTTYHELDKISQQTIGGGAEISIRLASVTPVFSMYIFDETAIIVFQAYQDFKGDIPHFIVSKGGTLYEFVAREFKTLVIERSKKSDRSPSAN